MVSFSVYFQGVPCRCQPIRAARGLWPRCQRHGGWPHVLACFFACVLVLCSIQGSITMASAPNATGWMLQVHRAICRPYEETVAVKKLNLESMNCNLVSAQPPRSTSSTVLYICMSSVKPTELLWVD